MPRKKSVNVDVDWCIDVAQRITKVETMVSNAEEKMDNHLEHHKALIRYLMYPLLIGTALALLGQAFNMFKLMNVVSALTKVHGM